MYGTIVLTENTSVEFKIIIKIQNDIRVYIWHRVCFDIS